MFGRLIIAAGCPVYPPSAFDHALGRFLKTTATGAHMYASILLAEEILDAFQREIMGDETLQPLIRMVSRVHVIEESRHIRFARDELARQVSSSGRIELAYSRLVIARAARSIVNRLVHPHVYAAVGIPPKLGRATARANPHFQSTLRWSAAKIVATLHELGLIGGPGRLLWTRSGLL
ncbi:diiron oxygenase [Allorhizocola rhizosphaerae]|uniref:diiron oxygenase n=1 Tax=Allorhizocola rhizosphaerae TaxID=1872709 RepID=UPI001FEC6FC2|nr:diiron oxygenase [Allorhizocola rhizosphaerae]